MTCCAATPAAAVLCRNASSCAATPAAGQRPPQQQLCRNASKAAPAQWPLVACSRWREGAVDEAVEELVDDELSSV